jgi:hypothetical protein
LFGLRPGEHTVFDVRDPKEFLLPSFLLLISESATGHSNGEQKSSATGSSGYFSTARLILLGVFPFLSVESVSTRWRQQFESWRKGEWLAKLAV